MGRWIALAAFCFFVGEVSGWAQLWSLDPVRQPTPPRTRFDSLAKNPIDRFVFAPLAAKGLAPNPPADRRALLRRVTIDLIGLPPTPEEMAAFLADRRPDAYERVVDRLLASPAYGERWARRWLDVVRFGESNGYERNLLRPNAWPYRDWVVDALNADMPYARFVTAQLAGDQVGDPIGTGFVVAGCHDDVPSPDEELTRLQRASDLDDMIATTTETFLGLTAGCARCHDHKFDPIPQTDYYHLAAVFADVRHGEQALKAQGSAPAGDPQRAMARLRRLAIDESAGKTLDPLGNEERFPPRSARFVRFTVLATASGEPCLDELEVYGPGSDENLARAGTPSASSALTGFAIHQVAHLNDGKLGNEHSWISNEAGAGWAQITLPETRTIDRVVWGRDAAGQFADRLPTAYRIDVSVDGTNWTRVAGGASRILPPSGDTPARAALRRELEKSRSAGAAYIGRYGDPEPVYFLTRGDVMQRGEEMRPGALTCVAVPTRFAASPRLELARWIVAPSNPLTWRVIVNRIWQGHFGVGLVATASDFGLMGERPTHPELLDYLAATFRNDGGSFKRLHRRIVTSYVYRQASATHPVGLRIDGANRMLWRGPLRRLESEALWDAVLATSGKLDRKRGGPPYALFTYRQENIAFYGPAAGYGPETWRRGLYRMNVRAVRDHLLACFDCPETAQRTPKRDLTTTALQAMSLFNGSFVREQAGHFAARVSGDAGPDPARRIARAWQLAYGRSPEPSEAALAGRLLATDGLPVLCRALMNTHEFLYY